MRLHDCLQFKTAWCSFFQKGVCDGGNQCTFAHHENDLQDERTAFRNARPDLPCKYYAQGKCERGSSCQYLHVDAPCSSKGKKGAGKHKVPSPTDTPEEKALSDDDRKKCKEPKRSRNPSMTSPELPMTFNIGLASNGKFMPGLCLTGLGTMTYVGTLPFRGPGIWIGDAEVAKHGKWLSDVNIQVLVRAGEGMHPSENYTTGTKQVDASIFHKLDLKGNHSATMDEVRVWA